MQLLVAVLHKTVVLNVGAGATAADVKRAVEDAEGVPALQQRLTCGGVVVGDGDAVGCEQLLRVTLPLLGGMDRQNRAGGKTGTGYTTSASAAAERKERLKQLAMETIDLSKDPYIFLNHLGFFECKLCLTLHKTEGNYLAHTQGKRHQESLAARAARDAAMQGMGSYAPASMTVSARKTLKIGRPGYKVVKQREPDTGQRSLLFELSYPEVAEGVQPRHRFMSAFEQRVEAPDKNFQFLLFACEPYETIGFKIPNLPVDKSEGKFFTQWDKDKQVFTLQLYFLTEQAAPPPAAAAAGPPGFGPSVGVHA